MTSSDWGDSARRRKLFAVVYYRKSPISEYSPRRHTSIADLKRSLQDLIWYERCDVRTASVRTMVAGKITARLSLEVYGTPGGQYAATKMYTDKLHSSRKGREMDASVGATLEK